MTYRLVDGGVLRTADGATIPNDPANTDWQAFQAWVGAGNNPDPLIPAPQIPTIAGTQIIGAMSDAQAGSAKLRDLIRIAVDPTVPVSNPKLIRIATAIGTTPGALFTAAQGA